MARGQSMKVIHTQGTRKKANARATITKGTGKVIINKMNLADYGDDMLRLRIQEPMVLAGEQIKKLNIVVVAKGGGITGQSDAIRLAIARGLVEHDEKLKKIFIDYDRLLLVADVRQKEVCKPNDSKARAKRQKSYR